MILKSKGKIAKYINGLPHFSEVELSIDTSVSLIDIIDTCSGSGWSGQGAIEDATSLGYDDWKAGARNGILYSLAVLGLSAKVDIQRITGMTTDTNPDIVFCAATNAVWSAFQYLPNKEEREFLDATLLGSWKNLARQ